MQIFMTYSCVQRKGEYQIKRCIIQKGDTEQVTDTLTILAIGDHALLVT